jgi:hypothetical protein
MNPCSRECEFRKFALALGCWFDGIAKFVDMMKRHNDTIYTGEQLMLDQLVRESIKLNRYLDEFRKRSTVEHPAEAEVPP